MGGLSYLPQICGALFSNEVAKFDLEFHNLQSQTSYLDTATFDTASQIIEGFDQL